MADHIDGSTRKPRTVRKDKPQPRPWTKATILLDEKLDMKLGVYAKMMRIDRSAAARKILEEKLGGMRISFGSVEAGEDEPVA